MTQTNEPSDSAPTGPGSTGSGIIDARGAAHVAGTVTANPANLRTGGVPVAVLPGEAFPAGARRAGPQPLSVSKRPLQKRSAPHHERMKVTTLSVSKAVGPVVQGEGSHPHGSRSRNSSGSRCDPQGAFPATTQITPVRLANMRKWPKIAEDLCYLAMSLFFPDQRTSCSRLLPGNSR